MKKAALIALLCGLCSVVVACNTVEGVGKDIKAGGEKIEKAAS